MSLVCKLPHWALERKEALGWNWWKAVLVLWLREDCFLSHKVPVDHWSSLESSNICQKKCFGEKRIPHSPCQMEFQDCWTRWSKGSAGESLISILNLHAFLPHLHTYRWTIWPAWVSSLYCECYKPCILFSHSCFTHIINSSFLGGPFFLLDYGLHEDKDNACLVYSFEQSLWLHTDQQLRAWVRGNIDPGLSSTEPLTHCVT